MYSNTFRLAISCIFTSLVFTHAHPLTEPPGSGGGGGGGSNNEKATLVVNTELVPLPIHNDFGTMRLNYSDGIERVRIDDAPPGYGCFFWSNLRRKFASGPAETDVLSSSSSPPPLPSEALLLQNKFVSQTFYSSNSSSSSHDFTTFDPPIVPDYLTCFTMPNPMRPDGWVSVWIESFSLPSQRPQGAGGEGEDKSSEEEATDLPIAKHSLIHIPLSNTVSDGRVGGITFNRMILMRRAALVHLPRYNAECMPIRGLTPEREEDLIRIAEDRQLMDPVSDAVGIVCTAESQNGRPDE